MSRPPKAKDASSRQNSTAAKRSPGPPAIDPRQVDWVSEVASSPAQKPPRQARGKRKVVNGEDGHLKIVWLTPEQAAQDRARMHAQRFAQHRQGRGKRARVQRIPNVSGVRPGKEVVAEVEARYPGSFAKQLLAVCTEFPQPARIGEAREIGLKTREDREVMAQRVPRDLSREGIRLDRLSSLAPRHVMRLVQRWRAAGVAPSTLAVMVSTLRSLLSVAGMDKVVPQVADLELAPGELKRQASAVRPKGWTAVGVDRDQVFERVRAECLHTYHALRLSAAFGLRALEALCARPAKMRHDHLLAIKDGTKGDRPRTVPVLTDEQRAVLDEAEAFSRTRSCKKGTITRRGTTLEQDYNHFRYVLRKLGITSKVLGVTPHGLRHDYLNERFEQLAGVPSPVMGGMVAIATLPKDVLRHAQQTVALEAGHGRRSISTAYLGSARNIRATEMAQMRQRLQQLEYHAPTVAWLHSVGAGEWFIVGDHAMGRLPLGKRTQLTLAGTIKRLDLVLDGARALKERLGFPVQVVDISTVDPESPRLELVSLSLISPANEPVAQPKPKSTEPGATQVAAPVQARLDVDDSAADAA
jgi:integrase